MLIKYVTKMAIKTISIYMDQIAYRMVANGLCGAGTDLRYSLPLVRSAMRG